VPWLYQMIATRRSDGSPASAGERAYQTQCASCHGLDRGGNPDIGAPSLVDVSRRLTPADVTRIVEQGRGRMPPAGALDAPRRAIVDLLFGVDTPGAGARPARTSDPPVAFGGFRRWFDPQGYPAIKPPWGTLNAVDLNTGELKWKVPLGEYRELTAKGIPPTGTENYGGPVVTASGLVFIGATADETIRAFDGDTGKVLWQSTLPFGGNATPSIYMVNGVEYVVISAGGGKSKRPAGGAIVAFAIK